MRAAAVSTGTSSTAGAASAAQAPAKDGSATRESSPPIRAPVEPARHAPAATSSVLSAPRDTATPSPSVVKPSPPTTHHDAYTRAAFNTAGAAAEASSRTHSATATVTTTTGTAVNRPVSSSSSPSSSSPAFQDPRLSTGSTSSGASSTGSTGSTGSGITSANPRRSLNAAFTLGPRSLTNASEVDPMDATISTPMLVLVMDRLDPPERYYCDTARIEDRRELVTESCVRLARHMSTERILSDLIPALLTVFECDDYGESFDDCAPRIARVLPDIVQCMSDTSVEAMTHLMGLIMMLACAAESTVVADITASLQRILKNMSDEVLIRLFLPLILSMRASYWASPRAVAAGLLASLAARPVVVAASGLTITDWFLFFTDSSRDPCVSVRQAAVSSLGQWIAVAEGHGVSSVAMPLPLVNVFITDDLSDTVRYLLVEELVRVAALIGKEASTKYLMNTYLTACGDPSWRVRYIAAEHLSHFAVLVSRPDDLHRVLMQLAEDEEPQIRSAVAKHVGELARCSSSAGVEKHCLPVFLGLLADPQPVVRKNAVLHAHPFVRLDNEAVVSQVCEAIVALLKDKVFSVQSCAIQGLEPLVQALEGTQHHTQRGHRGGDVASGSGSGSARSRSTTSSTHSSPPMSPPLSESSHAGRAGHHGEASARFHQHIAVVIDKLVESLQEMSGAGNWRLRDAVVHALQFFCGVLTPEQFKPLTRITRTLLSDPVSEVRTKAVESLAVVAKVYGAEWAAWVAAELLHTELSPDQQVAYARRVMSIRCLQALLPVVASLSPNDLRRQQLLGITTELLEQYSRDSVSNVRMALAEAMPSLGRWFSASPRELAIYNETVLILQQDTDRDVMEAAKELHKINVPGAESLTQSSASVGPY